MSLQGEGKELEKRSQSGCPSLNQLVQVQAEQFAARGAVRSLVAQSFPKWRSVLNSDFLGPVIRSYRQ